MRLVFAGTPHFAAQALAALIAAGHEIALVLTQPDRKAGRGMHPAMSPVKQLALQNRLEIAQPFALRDPIVFDKLQAAAPEAMVVAAYGLLLPESVLGLPDRGALNIHASLLPRWRGAAPIQRAILAGDSQTGITIMQMEAGLDTGPMLAQNSIPISSDDTALSLHDKLAELGASMIVRALSDLQAGAFVPRPQPAEGITYAHKIEKREAALEWRKPSRELDQVVRAFNPAPGAHATLGGDNIKIWRARPVDGSGDPGCVQSCAADGIVVTCGEGALLLTELQRSGAKRLSARDFLLGYPLSRGACFAPPA
jgi:methionyl-tRNA formyltransferase